MDGVSEREDRAIFSGRIALVDRFEECASHCLPVAAADTWVAWGAAGGGGGGQGGMGRRRDRASPRLSVIAPQPGLDDGGLGTRRSWNNEKALAGSIARRSEERRVGKEWRSRGAPVH